MRDLNLEWFPNDFSKEEITLSVDGSQKIFTWEPGRTYPTGFATVIIQEGQILASIPKFFLCANRTV